MNVTALWVGDSFTRGEGAGVPPERTYPHLVGARLGWTCHVDAQNGTGFVNDGWAAGPDLAPLAVRLPDDVRRWAPDRVGVVVVDGGRNDAGVPEPALRRAVAEYLTALRSAYACARLVLVLPTLVDTVQPPEYDVVARVLRTAAPAVGAAVVDPVGAGTFADAARNRPLVGPDGFHPSAAGQAHYADVLARLLPAALAEGTGTAT
jgi:lysophospholipase L1-like esterase